MANIKQLRLLMRPAEAAWRSGEAIRTAAERIGARRGSTGSAFHPATGAAPLPVLLIPSLQRHDRTIELWGDLFPDSMERTVAAAREIRENKIPIFSESVDFGNAIDWHVDRCSGKRAPRVFYRDIDTLDPAEIGDAKHIWELNRCNFLLTLGRACGVTGDQSFFKAWREIVLSWIDANPFNIGINWVSSLELAIRAINWIWSSAFFVSELERDSALRDRFMRVMCLHGLHIERHLSYYFSPNTHLTGEALGLLYLGTAFPALDCSNRWRRTAETILKRELRRQILADGGYFERATYYHKYTIDFYLHYLLLSPQVDAEARGIISNMVRHLTLLAGPDGTIPLLGDSDGGQLLSLSANKRSIRGVCCASSVLLGDSELKSLCGDAFDEEALWLLGEDGIERFRALPEISPRWFHSINADTGYFCLRGSGGQGPAIVIDCGPHGWNGCGHAHADLLSFVLYGAGAAVIDDQGTYTYSGSKEIRDASRSSQSHNTITINDVSQSLPGEVFRWRSVAHPRGVFCRVAGEFGYFEGEHDAYDTLACRHKRVVLFFGGRLIVIVDLIRAGRSISSLLYNLQFAPGSMETLGNRFYRFVSGVEEFFVRIDAPKDMDVEIEKGMIYPDYHRAVPAPRLRLRETDLQGERRIITVLAPERGLIEGFERDESGLLRIAEGSANYRIAAGLYAGRSTAFEAEISALAVEGARRLAILRNAAGTPGVGEEKAFETAKPCGFMTACMEGDALSLTADERVPPFRTPIAVRTVTVNGIPATFDYRRGCVWITSEYAQGR
jgi:hypothetical protein